MTKDELKRAVCNAIDRNGNEIIELGERILHHPETGFNEDKTAARVAERMRTLGLEPQTGLALTGGKDRLKGKASGPRLAFIGELDSLRTSDHPLADPHTGAAHSCGHNAQIAGMLGVAMGLSAISASDHFAGELVLFAVPAEEFIDVEERLHRKERGAIEFLLGKPELVAKGHFDDIDMAMMIHVGSHDQIAKRSYIADSSNSAVVKQIRFLGRASHAGGAPQLGINPLSAALIALNAIHAQREPSTTATRSASIRSSRRAATRSASSRPRCIWKPSSKGLARGDPRRQHEGRSLPARRRDSDGCRGRDQDDPRLSATAQ